MSEFLRHDKCPECGSSDNVSVYWNEKLKGETFYCHTPGCSNKKTDYNLAREKSSINLDSHPLSDKALKRIGFTREVAARYDITMKGHKLFFGYRDETGCLVRAKGRNYDVPKDDDHHFFWVGDSKSTTLYGMFACNNKWHLAITSGEKDAPAIAQVMGWSAVSVPNGDDGALKYIRANLKWIQKRFEKVYLVFDNDAQGQNVVEEVAALIKKGVHICVLPKIEIEMGVTTKDAYDFLRYHKEEELKTALYASQPWMPPIFYSGNDLKSEVKSILYDANRYKGYSTGIPALDDHLGGLRVGEVSVWMGNPGRGKSTLTRGIMGHLSQRLKCGYITLEEIPGNAVLQLLEGATGLNLIKSEDKPTPDEIDDLIDKYITDKIYPTKLHGVLSIDTVRDTIYYGNKTLGIEFFLLDHIDAATEGEEKKHEAITKMMALVNSLAQELLVHVAVVSHTHRKESDIEALEQGVDAVPTLRDAFGSSSIEKYAHIFCALQKVHAGTKCHVLKNRLWGVDSKKQPPLLMFSKGRFWDAKNPTGQEMHVSERHEVRQQTRASGSEPLPGASAKRDEVCLVPTTEETTTACGVSQERPSESGGRGDTPETSTPVQNGDVEPRLPDSEREDNRGQGSSDSRLLDEAGEVPGATPRDFSATPAGLFQQRPPHPGRGDLWDESYESGDSLDRVDRSSAFTEKMAKLLRGKHEKSTD